MTYSFGDVLLLHFPFTNSSETKPRPVIALIDTGDDDFLLTRVTPQEPHSSFDVTITDWEKTGLRLSFIVRLHKLVTLHKRCLIRNLGKVLEKDRENLKAVLKIMWDL